MRIMFSFLLIVIAIRLANSVVIQLHPVKIQTQRVDEVMKASENLSQKSAEVTKFPISTSLNNGSVHFDKSFTLPNGNEGSHRTNNDFNLTRFYEIDTMAITTLGSSLNDFDFRDDIPKGETSVGVRQTLPSSTISQQDYKAITGLKSKISSSVLTNHDVQTALSMHSNESSTTSIDNCIDQQDKKRITEKYLEIDNKPSSVTDIHFQDVSSIPKNISCFNCTARNFNQFNIERIAEKNGKFACRTITVSMYNYSQSGESIQNNMGSTATNTVDNAAQGSVKSHFTNETIFAITSLDQQQAGYHGSKRKNDSTVMEKNTPKEGIKDKVIHSTTQDVNVTSFPCRTTKTKKKYLDTFSTTSLNNTQNSSNKVSQLITEGTDNVKCQNKKHDCFSIEVDKNDPGNVSTAQTVNTQLSSKTDVSTVTYMEKNILNTYPEITAKNKSHVNFSSVATSISSPAPKIIISTEIELNRENYTVTTNPFACKTIHVERDRPSKSKDHVPNTVKRITISNRNREKAKKMTKVRPLTGSVSSNAGFVTVNRKYGARLFFWFVRSRKNPENAPVIIWLQGQPGWSSLYGMFEEHGPYRVVETDNGIRFELREFAWTNEFNVLYLDHCVGCGYSTALRKAAYKPSYEMVGKNVYSALEQFFKVFSEFSENDLYLAGEHGCAKYIPVVAHAIHLNNGIKDFKINLKGVLIGGPYIDSTAMASYSDYLYMIGLIDEREQEDLYIDEQYAKALIRASKFNEAIAFLKQILYSKFDRAGYKKLYDVRYEKPKQGVYRSEYYMPKVVKNEPFVSAIQTEGLQFRSRSEILIEEIMRPVDGIMMTILQNYKVLYYNGQFDMLTPYSLTASYLSEMKWSESDLFYSSQLNNWYATNENFPDGYWKYSNNLTHVMIRNAGHTVGSTKPKILLHLLKWFTNGQFEKPYSLPSLELRYLNTFV